MEGAEGGVGPREKLLKGDASERDGRERLQVATDSPMPASWASAGTEAWRQGGGDLCSRVPWWVREDQMG